MGDVLIVCYSRSGSSRKVAEGLRGKLGGEGACDADFIEYAGKAQPGILKVLFQAVFRRTCGIEGDAHDASAYRRVVVVTPVWAAGVSVPVRSYLKKHGGKIASYSLISVMEGNGAPERDAAAAAGKAPVNSAVFLSRDVKGGKIDYESLAVLAE